MNDNIINLISDIVQYNYIVPSGSRFNNTFVPLPITGVLISPNLNVNGLVYNLDDDVTLNGFGISYDISNIVSLSWNFIDGNGFSLVDTDNIVLHYSLEQR